VAETAPLNGLLFVNQCDWLLSDWIAHVYLIM